MNSCKECGVNEKAPGRSRCWSCYTKYRKGSPKPYYTQPSDCRMLFIDIETSPNKVYTWGLWKQNIGVNQIVESTKMLCFAASWYGDNSDEAVMFFKGTDEDSYLAMVQAAWKLLDEADVLVHFYGSEFDVKHLNREFLENGFPPPSPFKQIDLKKVASKQFYFPSNKLQYVSTALGFEGKVKHEGFELWLGCMANDEESWTSMEEYNRQDVVLLEGVYEVLLPWIPNHPHRWLYDGVGGCPTCGAEEPLAPSGYAYTKVSRFRQYRCESCGTYHRDSRRIDGVTLQESVR